MNALKLLGVVAAAGLTLTSAMAIAQDAPAKKSTKQPAAVETENPSEAAACIGVTDQKKREECLQTHKKGGDGQK